MVLPNTPGVSEETEEAPRGGSRIAIWLIILGLALLFLPLYLISSTIKDSSSSLQTDLDSVQATLAYTPPPNPTTEALNGTLTYVGAQSSALGSLESTLVAINVNWPNIMATIGAFNPGVMSISAISQTATGITITGQADSQNTVTAYADVLLKSGVFEGVTVDSINILPAPTATPSPTPTPGATVQPTVEASPPARLEPQSIALFEISVTMKVKSN